MVTKRRKVSTVLDEQLFRRTKLEAARRGMQISDVIGEALAVYLAEAGAPEGGGGMVARSWGALALDCKRVREVIEEGGALLDP